MYFPLKSVAVLFLWSVYTFKRNKNATFFNGKCVTVLLFKVLETKTEQSCFLESFMNLSKLCYEQLSIQKKRILVRITSVSADVNVSYFLCFCFFFTSDIQL